MTGKENGAHEFALDAGAGAVGPKEANAVEGDDEDDEDDEYNKDTRLSVPGSCVTGTAAAFELLDVKSRSMLRVSSALCAAFSGTDLTSFPSSTSAGTSIVARKFSRTRFRFASDILALLNGVAPVPRPSESRISSP